MEAEERVAEELEVEELEEPVGLEVTELKVGRGMWALPGRYAPSVVISVGILETQTLLVDPLETSTAAYAAGPGVRRTWAGVRALATH